MQLEKIITLANHKTRLRLLAMIRSLRAAGSHLPVWVIPYDDDRFELPVDCIWWEDKRITGWLTGRHHAHHVMRKYQCLTECNYQFADADVIFLRNPEKVLQPHTGFITSCGHWHNPGHTTTKEVLAFFNQTTTVWQQKVFNSGQFACDKKLFNADELKTVSEDKNYCATCFDFKYHEQPGINLLVNLSGVEITNLTLQPYFMESTWAGDYPDSDFERFWKKENNKPYLIHWAGCSMNINRPIDKLFLNFLTDEEKVAWNEKVLEMAKKQKNSTYSIKKLLKRAGLSFLY